MLELTDGGDWSWRSYVEFVTENIEPLPQANIKFVLPNDSDISFGDIIKNFGAFIDWLGDLFFYPIEFLAVCLRNIIVILDGFLPFDFTYSKGGIGEAGGGSLFGSFGGGGFGGGGGGAR